MASPLATGALQQNSELQSVPHNRMWVVCLCAAWCRACEDYRSIFASASDLMAPRYLESHFVWFDVEDHADVMGDLEIENFPSVLIADVAGIRFLGPITPQLGTLVRLVEAMHDSAAPIAPHLPETRMILNRLASRTWPAKDR